MPIVRSISGGPDKRALEMSASCSTVWARGRKAIGIPSRHRNRQYVLPGL